MRETVQSYLTTGSEGESNYRTAPGWLALALVFAVLPFVTERWLVHTFVLANVFAIFVLSWNVISGQTDYISFGHSFFVGVAAYTTAILSVTHGFSAVVSAGIGIVVAMLAGVMIALPTLRLRGVYFTFLTLLLPILGERVAIAQNDITGGRRGIIGIPGFVEGLLINYYVTTAALLLTAYGTWYLLRSDFGTTLRMIGQSEELVENSGINPTKFKLLAFMVSAFIAGVGGVLKVHFLGTVTIDSVLALPLAINIVIAAVIGGRGSTMGAIAGAYFFALFNAYTQPILPTAVRLLIFYAIGIVVIALFPKGIVPILREKLVDIQK